MSGVYINGMEMPDRCFACPMCSVEDNEADCAISHGAYIEYKEIDMAVAIQDRPDWCPLIPVPDLGRLIDAEALQRVTIEQQSNDYNIKAVPRNWAYAFCAFEEIVADAPTIIPADKEGE